MPIWQLCANLLIPNCLRSNLSYSPLAALELYVIRRKPKNSYFKDYRHNTFVFEGIYMLYYAIKSINCILNLDMIITLMFLVH